MHVAVAIDSKVVRNKCPNVFGRTRGGTPPPPIGVYTILLYTLAKRVEGNEGNIVSTGIRTGFKLTYIDAWI